MKYTLIGAGAIGGSMAAYISRAGGEILYVDVVPEHVSALNRCGMRIYTPGKEDFTVPVKAELLQDLDEPLECVLLATKSQHTADAMKVIAPLLKPEGFVVSLQNGLNEYIISDYAGRERTVGAFVNWAADYMSPGVIQFAGHSNFAIGELDGRTTERVLALQEFFTPFQKPEISGNILSQLWSKQVNICAMFATGMTPLMIDGGMIFPETQETIACIALEAMQVPYKLGVPLVEFDDFKPELYRQGRYADAMKATSDHYHRMVKNYTGLYRDLAVRKRKSEIDGTVGLTIEIGEREGLELPLCRKFVGMIKEIEAGERLIRTENLLELKKEYEKLYPEGLAGLLKFLQEPVN